MEKEQLLARAKRQFEDNKGLTELHYTKDGQGFQKLGDAKEHGTKQLKEEHPEITSITREEALNSKQDAPNNSDKGNGGSDVKLDYKTALKPAIEAEVAKRKTAGRVIDDSAAKTKADLVALLEADDAKVLEEAKANGGDNGNGAATNEGENGASANTPAANDGDNGGAPAADNK